MTFCRPVVLDACVLVGAGLRDMLLRLAEVPALYAPRWSDDILGEVERTLQRRFGKTIEQTRHLTHQLRESFPEACVREYSDLIPNLINHEKDRHVLAAAVRCGAQGIVTFNTRHFPAEAVCRFDIQVIHPDKFLVEQLCQDETLVVTRFSEQARNIGRTVEDQTRTFHRTGALPRFTLALAKTLGIQLG
jgi:predicted nucleic acid-binding protein